MTNLFNRIKDAVSSDIHELLDEKEQKNPIATLNQYLRQSEAETEKVRKLVERQYRLKEEFTREYQKAQDLADKRKKQAELAERAGEKEMADFAAHEYLDYQARADRMKESRRLATEQLDQLEQKYEEMKRKIKDMHLKRMDLMGRENMAHAYHRINRMMEDSWDKPYSKFSEMERYIENLEYKVNSAYYRNTFDQKMAKLEREWKEKETYSVNE